jgi:hypothetical protein
MDRNRFDALARLLATRGSRRGALSSLLGVALLGRDPGEGLAKPGKRKRKAHRRDGGDKKRSKQRDKQRGKQRGKARQGQAQAEAIPASCCSANSCIPGPGNTLKKCCLQGQNLSGQNLKGANLGSANLSGANLSGANFSGANLSKACLVDADLRGATIDGSTNLDDAVFCRTQTDTGENNSGCTRGTACCETCPGPCPVNQRCCPDGTCQECCNNRQCPDGQRCVNGRCVCNAASCPDGCCTNGPGNPGECRPSSDDTCGINGAQCVDCPDGVLCNAQGRCVCDATSCSNGCCDTATGPCIRPPTDENCGRNGEICVACPAGQRCVDGRCVCDRESCGNGCCTNGPGNPGECRRPQPNNDACGINGVRCVDCPVNTVCAGGQCQCAPGFKPCGTLCIPNASCCTGTSEGCAEPTPNCCVIDGNGVCRDCCANSDCTGATNTCANNQCRCGAGPACTEPNETCCGTTPQGICIDTTTDRNNCGRCGNVCPAQLVCRAGECNQCQSSAQCGPNRVCCGGQCFAGICCAFGGPCRPENECCNIHGNPPSRSCCVGGGLGRCCLRNATPGEILAGQPVFTVCVQDSDCCVGPCLAGVCSPIINPDFCP